MVKALDSTYDAGRRGGAWRKVKPVRTLDLVVLAAEWGHGRRQGWLSNLHLGARGPDGHVRDGRQDVQGPHRRACCEWQTEELLGTRDRPRRDHRVRAPRARRRDRARRRAGVDAATRAASRCASPGSAATATTRPRTTPTRSRRCRRCCHGRSGERCRGVTSGFVDEVEQGGCRQHPRIEEAAPSLVGGLHRSLPRVLGPRRLDQPRTLDQRVHLERSCASGGRSRFRRRGRSASGT